MSTLDVSGDYASGIGSGESSAIAVAADAEPLSQWVVGLAVVLSIFPAVSWTRRRCAVSLLVAVWAFVSLANLASVGQSWMGIENRYWLWSDYGVGLVVDLVALLYVFAADHPCVYLFAVATVALFVADVATTGNQTLHVAWHVTAYMLLGLIPGQLPMSVDDPEFYYERRKRWRRESRVPVPQYDPSPRDGSPDYPGLYIPRGENYFQ